MKHVFKDLTRQVKKELTLHASKTWSYKLSKLSHKDNTLRKTTKILKTGNRYKPTLKYSGETYMTDEKKVEVIATVLERT